MARAGLKPGITGMRVQRTDHSATLPPPQSFRLVKLLLSYSKRISINDFYLLVVIVKKLPHSLPSDLVAMFSHSPTPSQLQFSHDIFSDHFVHRHACLLSTSMTLPVFTFDPDESP